MTTDNHSNRVWRNNPPDRTPNTDGTGKAGPDDARGMLMPSGAMSALLARNWWVIALRGVFAVLFGVIALLLPGVTLASLVLLFAVYMLVDGVLDILAGIRAAQRHERWSTLVLEGIADLIAGGIAFVWPVITLLVFIYLMAAWAIVSGAMLLGAAFRLRRAYGQWLMGLGGVVSVIWGLLLMFWPITGAVVLTWWMGGYAIFFGVTLIGLAFQLRSRHTEHRDHVPQSTG